MGYWFAHYRHVFPGRFVFGLLLRIYDFLAGLRDRRFLNRERDFLERVPGYQGC
jgi:glycerol-3-phosphate dehydrogenase